MWTNLNSKTHIAFYESFDSKSQDLFAKPMRKAVEYLQTLPLARDLFAFTSHARFQVTTAPSISEDQGHWFIGLIYDHHRSQYCIYMKLLSEGWIFEPHEPKYFPPTELEAVLRDFIERLSRTTEEGEQAMRGNGEQAP